MDSLSGDGMVVVAQLVGAGDPLLCAHGFGVCVWFQLYGFFVFCCRFCFRFFSLQSPLV